MTAKEKRKTLKTITGPNKLNEKKYKERDIEKERNKT